MSRIIVKNLPKNISEQRINKLFGDKGVITDVQLKFKDGKFRQFAFVGFKEEESASEAVKYFNGTYIGSSKIIVEPCAGLGDDTKPKSWSKYAKDSEAFKKKNKEVEEKIEEIPVEVKKPEKKKKKSEKIDEILGDHKDDPMFQEFLKSHAKDKLLWENDIAKDSNVVKESKSEVQKESIPVENDKIADAKISDKDYMKQLMGEEVDLSESVKKENYVKLYTIKIRNIPKKSKRGDLIKFFRPLKAHSVRIPPKSNYAYVGFKLESELKRALNKDKSFLKGKQVHVFDFTDQQSDQPHKKEEQRKNPRWEEQETQIEGNEEICETGKLFFRNLAYTVTEEDLQKLFEKFGPVAELNLPVDSFTRKIKGFGTVIFVMPENAVSAYTELNGSNFHGRMFHLMPGKSDDKNGKDDEIEESNFKKKKQAELKKSAQSAHNWNTLFLGTDAVAEVMAKQFGKTKDEILDTSSGGTSAAVRIALGETQIVLEMKKFLEKHGVRLEVFDDMKAKRSKTIIIAKNLPPNTTEEEMREKFSPFGALEKIVLPPSGVTCLIKFESGTEARKAFVKLAYTKFKKLPLFLEWAPENTFKDKSEFNHEEENDEEKVEEKKNVDEDDEIPPQPNTTLFIKNLSLSTTENSIREHFNHIGAIHTIQIATKKNPENPQKPVPLGYGFIQFKLSSSTDKALRNLQFSTLDDQKIELKRSDRTLQGQNNDRITSQSVVKKKEGSAKILVKNVPFQAGGNELREIFKVFGDIKAVRLPRKVGASGGEQHRGFGFVDFVTKSDAKQAFEALRHSTHLYGRRLILEWADNDEDVTEIRKRTAQQAGAMTNGPPKKKSVIEGDDYVKAKSDDEDEF